MDIQSLADISIGEPKTIDSLVGEPLLCQRLQALGFHIGEQVIIEHRVLFGEPCVVRVQNLSVALRKEELSCVRVK